VKYFVDADLIGVSKPKPLTWLGAGVVESMFTWVAPPPGRHLLQGVAVTADGAVTRSEPVVLIVKERY